MRELTFGRSNPNPDNVVSAKCSTDGKIPVRIDKRTIIYANDPADAERIRKQYNLPCKS
jgi:hypothetical protein